MGGESWRGEDGREEGERRPMDNSGLRSTTVTKEPFSVMPPFVTGATSFDESAASLAPDEEDAVEYRPPSPHCHPFH